MMFEEQIEKLQAGDAAWDDVRERRVFNRIREELDAPTDLAARAPRSALAALGGIAALFLIGLITFYGFRDSDDRGRVPGAPAVSSSEQTPSVQPSVMVIGEVGQVTLMDGARVAILHQTTQVVKLLQTRGKAAYEINHQAGREVFVYAGEVEIRVVGTAFTVTMRDELVNVHVSKGIVRINDGNRLVELRSGETIGVAARSGDGDPGSVASQNEDSDAKMERNDPAAELGLSDMETTGDPQEDPNADSQTMGKTRNRNDGDSFSKWSTKSLFDEVDKARKDNNLNKAARMLEVIIARNDNRSSVVSALFTLGKVERANDKHVRAANAFFRCFKLANRGPLAEDALAETAAAWFAAENIDNAKKTAQSYLRRYPSGIHGERMNLILK